jgi:hypothetical protein
MESLGFFAYPESSPIVTEAIKGAVELSAKETLKLKPWEEMRIIGFKLDDLIRDQIHDVEVLAADISYPNHNVLYEIGYAIAVGKPVIPTVNVAIEKSIERVQKIGLFDTIGWATYVNADELSSKLRDWNDVSWRNRYTRRRDHGQPLFILDALKKTDFRNYIFHAVENSQVNYRKFDPAEIPRLTAAQAIAEVSSSAGVIIPICPMGTRSRRWRFNTRIVPRRWTTGTSSPTLPFARRLRTTSRDTAPRRSFGTSGCRAATSKCRRAS